MNNIVFLYASFDTDYSKRFLFNNKSAIQLAVEWAKSISSVSKIVLFTNDDSIKNIFSNEKELIETVYSQEWNSNSLLEKMAEYSKSYDVAIYSWADLPLLNTTLTEKLIDHHVESLSEYCFADGYPYGLTPEIIHPGTINILSNLCKVTEKFQNKEITRDFLFELMKTDINSFEIETILALNDYRTYRFSFSCGNKSDTSFCQKIYEFADKINPSKTDIDTLCEKAISNENLLINLPSFYNIQISSNCSGKCTYCPYPQKYLEKYDKNPCETSEFMQLDSFTKIIENVNEFSGEAVVSLSMWGEALKNPNLIEFIKKIMEYSGLSVLIEISGEKVDKNLFNTIAEVINKAKKRTNGYEKIYWIVSIDSCDQASYEVLHGQNEDNNYQYAIENMLVLKELFPNCVYPQYIRLKENEEQLEAFYRYWNENNHGKLIIQKYDWFSGEIEQKKVADLAPINRNPCWHLRRDFCILLNGDVPLCKAEFFNASQGNIFKESFSEIWKKRNAILKDHLADKYSSKCGKCDEYYTFNF